MFQQLTIAAATVLAAAAPSYAAASAPDIAPGAFDAALKYQQGKIVLPEGIATLGMIVPTKVSALSKEGWGGGGHL